MHFRFLLFTLSVLLLAGSWTTRAQEPPTLLFSHLTTEDGLSSNNVWALAKDSIGYLWAGTENGLNRFDGLHCTAYLHRPGVAGSLSGSDVHHLLPAGGGNLWVGTQSGLSLYRQSTNNFVSFGFPGAEGRGTKPQYVFPFYTDAQAKLWLYLGARGAIATWDLRSGKITWVSSQSNGYLFALQPPGKRLQQYITRLEKGILIGQLEGEKMVSSQDFFARNTAGAPPTFIDQIVAESDTGLWLCADAGLIALNPKTGRQQVFSQFAGRPVDANCAVRLNKRYLLVGTAGEGLLLFDKMRAQFVKQYRHFAGDPRSIAGNTINRCLLDSGGNLFVAVANHGIDRANLQQAMFTPALFGEMATRVGISGNITAVYPLPGEKLLCGTDESGVLIYDLRNEEAPRRLGPAGKTESLTGLPAGEVLVQNADAFYKYQPGSKTLQKLALQLPKGATEKRLVQCFAQMPGGPLLAATTAGLMEVVVQQNTLHFILRKEVTAATEWSNFQFVAPLSDTQLLLQTYATNLYLLRFKGGLFTVQKEVARTPFRTYGMALGNGFAYLATSAGLRRFHLQKEELEELPEAIATACEALVKTDAHTLWISTTGGLYRYHMRTRQAHHFGFAEGLHEVLFNPGALTTLAGRQLAAGSVGGLVLFSDSLGAPIQNKAPAVLQQVLVNDSPAGENGSLPASLQLHYKQNSLTFTFNTIDFTAPEKNVLSYQLAGYDERPLTALGEATVRYAQLPPGKYRFIVRGSGGRQTLTISIAPPWWQTGWAKGGGLLLLASGIAFTFWLRLRFVRQKAMARLALTIRSGEEERRRIARDLHDDFGARLSTLKLYLLSAGKNPGLLTASAGLIDGAIVELRRILRNLSPRALEENGLQAAVADLAESINQTGALHCELDMQAFSQRLAPRTEYALYRAVQELIGNTLKHAGASQILLSFVVRDALLVILYEDNGKGFDAGVASQGYGLQNLQTHVESVRGVLHFDTAPRHGFAATMEIPLNKSNLL